MRTLPPTTPPPFTPTRLKGFTLKRACDFRLGDNVVMVNWKGAVEVVTVTTLTLVGDDVEFEDWTTSLGNVFVVVDQPDSVRN